MYAINSAGAGPKVQMRITMDIKGISLNCLLTKCCGLNQTMSIIYFHAKAEDLKESLDDNYA